MATPAIQQMFEMALQQQKTGRLREAEQLYRQILAQQPAHFDATNNLSMILHQTGRIDMAADFSRRAISLRPNIPEPHMNLGNALRALGRLEEAIRACRQAIALRPDISEAQNALGIALAANRQFGEAIVTFRKAISLRPDIPEAYYNLGIALAGDRKLDEAIEAYRQAIALRADDPDAHYNLGIVYSDNAMHNEAIAAFERAIALKSGLIEAHINLGNSLVAQERLEEAIATYQRVLRQRPDHQEVHNNLGVAFMKQGRLDEASDEFRAMIRFKPDSAEAHMNLGIALQGKGRIEESIASSRRAVELRPDYPAGRSNLLLSLHYLPGFDPRELAEEHRRWDMLHARRVAQSNAPHANDRNPDRRLRIAYVSSDFRGHVVGRLVLPLLEQHDHENFEIFCYSNVAAPDEMTARFRSLADQWRDIWRVGGEQVAQTIRADGIDILIDLAGHTSGNRLLVFARKPAPIQASFLGYPTSTGLSAIDFRLSDGFADPPDLKDPADRVVRLPRTDWCFAPDQDDPPVQPSPGIKAGFITFGCLNNFAKVNHEPLSMWSRIMTSVPQSRLLLLSPVGETRQWVIDQLAVDPGRVQFVPQQPRDQYLKTYDRIDVGLDTFPYHGVATTCDALWMGVPVVVLAGRTHVSRAGVSLLTNIGLPELIADTPSAYVEIAGYLAGDVGQLEHLRQGMRARMSASPLMDAPRYARDVEAAYRQAWREWCSDKAP